MQCTSNASSFGLNYPLANPTSLAHKSSGINSLNFGSKNLKNGQNVSSNKSVTHTKSTEDYDFKHVSKPELEAVVKRVRRANQKKKDEEEWKCFLKLKQGQNFCDENGSNVENKPLSDESTSCKDCGLIELPLNTHSLRQQASGREEEEAVAEDSVYPSAAASVTALDESHLYQLGGGLTKRLQDLLATVNKMTGLLLNPCLQSQYEDEDVDRTIKRSQEFDAMFARNHLYEIQRLLKDTKHLISTKSNNTVDLESKISAALKSLTQALQVYTRHVSKGSRIKYQQVVPIFQSINTTLGYIEHLTGQRRFSLRQDIEVSCSYMRQVLLDMSVTDTKSVSSVSRASVVRTQTRHRHKPSADLSMYNRRHRPDWRRKTASLARARFGPPAANKKQLHCKDVSNAKEVPYRNATRAVPEERVTTMMEMIPLEDPNSTKEATLALNKKPRPSSARSLGKGLCSLKPDDLQNFKINSKNTKIPQEQLSSSKEPRNVKLVYLMEMDSKSKPAILGDELNHIKFGEDSRRVITLDEKTKDEALLFHQKMLEYQQSSSIYKDNKALGIVDRLATNILSEMISDFQNKEMDQVVQLLYKLEFE